MVEAEKKIFYTTLFSLPIFLFLGQSTIFWFVPLSFYSIWAMKFRFHTSSIIYIFIMYFIINIVLSYSAFDRISSYKDLFIFFSIIFLGLITINALISKEIKAFTVNQKYIIPILCLISTIIIIENFSNNLITLTMSRVLLNKELSTTEPLDKGITAIAMLLPLFFLCVKNYKWAVFTLLAFAFLCTPMFAAKLAFSIGAGAFILAHYFPLFTTIAIFVPTAVLLIFMPIFMHILIINPHHVYYTTMLPFSWQYRIDMWTKITHLIPAHPMFGWGFGSSRFIDQATAIDKHITMQVHPHNIAMQLWLEGGVVSIIIGCLLVYFISKYIIQQESVRRAALLSFASIAIVFLMFSYGLQRSWFIASIFIALYLINIIVPTKIVDTQ